MTGKNTPGELITPEEATALSFRAGTVESIKRASRIFDKFIKEAINNRGYEEDYAFLCTLAAIYDTGRIQGIREQRAARSSRN